MNAETTTGFFRFEEDYPEEAKILELAITKQPGAEGDNNGASNPVDDVEQAAGAGIDESVELTPMAPAAAL